MSQTHLELHEEEATPSSVECPAFVKEAQAIFVELRTKTLKFIKLESEFDRLCGYRINSYRWPSEQWSQPTESVPEAFHKAIGQLIGAFYDKAERAFSTAAGVSVSIKDDDYEAIREKGMVPALDSRLREPADIENLRADFNGAWDYLAARYLGDSAKTAGLSAAAKFLFKEFDFSANPPTFKAGKLVANHVVYWDDSYGLVSGWCFYSRNETSRIISALRDFCRNSGLACYGTESFLSYFSSNKRTPSGETFEIADGLTIRPYKGRIEFRFEGRTAEAFQAFISTYAH